MTSNKVDLYLLNECYIFEIIQPHVLVVAQTEQEVLILLNRHKLFFGIHQEDAVFGRDSDLATTVEMKQILTLSGIAGDQVKMKDLQKEALKAVYIHAANFISVRIGNYFCSMS